MRDSARETGADPSEAARRVRAMFARVVPRYDLLNHLLSFNLDRGWRARTARQLRPWLQQPGARALDLGCGTGDLLAALARESRQQKDSALLVGCDFCHPMLTRARQKLPEAVLVEGDALALPFPDAAFDLVAVAFGLRNFADTAAGLREMRRVLRRGGLAAVLEFSRPHRGWLRLLYGGYSRWWLPRLGSWISGDAEAYRYLPASVERFPGPAELAALMRAAGFSRVEYRTMSGGIVALHLGQA